MIKTLLNLYGIVIEIRELLQSYWWNHCPTIKMSIGVNGNKYFNGIIIVGYKLEPFNNVWNQKIKK